MIWWEGGVGNVDSNGMAVPVEACVWGPYRGELVVWYLMSRERLANEMKRNKLATGPGGTGRPGFRLM
ncbi:hypothetical protein EES42_41065 [Streptomyces sp. ADI95-17]|nr:hypothetical protein EES42_41065 [Streptomyces sp. ADI95-17]